MKKKVIMILSITLVAVICLMISFILYENNQEKKVQERYAEIKESVKKGVEWNIRAQYPKCSIAKEFKKTSNPGSFYNSSFLINQGYIKKSELLDIDENSYCDVYVKINPYYENPLDYQQNCKIYYKIYLKCKDYEDKGYINWG